MSNYWNRNKWFIISGFVSFLLSLLFFKELMLILSCHLSSLLLFPCLQSVAQGVYCLALQPISIFKLTNVQLNENSEIATYTRWNHTAQLIIIIGIYWYAPVRKRCAFVVHNNYIAVQSIVLSVYILIERKRLKLKAWKGDGRNSFNEI